MPTYQYSCTACGHQLEAVQSFSDDPLTQCPTCQGRLRKLFGSVGIVFKGSGFYRTDSRAAANGKAANGKDGDSKDGDSKSNGNGSKPAESGSSTESGTKTGAAAEKPAAASTTKTTTGSAAPAAS